MVILRAIGAAHPKEASARARYAWVVMDKEAAYPAYPKPERQVKRDMLGIFPKRQPFCPKIGIKRKRSS